VATLDGTMPTLSSEHQDLVTARTRLTELHHRTLAAIEWCVALVILAGVLWLVGSHDLAFSVAAGALTAVAVGALAADERRRVLLGLVVQGDATSIPDVRALADRLAHDPGERRRVAASLRAAAHAERTAGRTPAPISLDRVRVFAPRMLAIADAIAEEGRSVEPTAIALCRTLLSDGATSPLYNTNLPERELDRLLAVVEAGIAPPALAGREPSPAVAREPASLAAGPRSAVG
jgi:hypothetical protein